MQGSLGISTCDHPGLSPWACKSTCLCSILMEKSQREETPCEARDWSDTVTNQGMPAAAGSWDRRARTPEPLERARPCPRRGFGLRPSRTTRRSTSVVFSHQVCGNHRGSPRISHGSFKERSHGQKSDNHCLHWAPPPGPSVKSAPETREQSCGVGGGGQWAEPGLLKTQFSFWGWGVKGALLIGLRSSPFFQNSLHLAPSKLF